MTASGTFVRPDTDEISQNNETNSPSMTTDKTKTKTYMPNVINRPKTAIGTFQKSVTINTPKKTPRKTPQKTKTGPRTTKTAQIRPMTSMTLSMNKTFVKTGKAKKSSEINPMSTYGGTWVGTFVKTGKAKSPEINKVVEKIDSGDFKAVRNLIHVCTLSVKRKGVRFRKYTYFFIVVTGYFFGPKPNETAKVSFL